MKNSIKLTGLFLLLSTGLFAAKSINTNSIIVPSAKTEVTFSSLPSQKGLDIRVESSAPAKATVIVYDQNANVIFKNTMATGKITEKGYILDQLEYGDYTIEVISNKVSEKKEIHVYDEDGKKMFFVKQS